MTPSSHPTRGVLLDTNVLWAAVDESVNKAESRNVQKYLEDLGDRGIQTYICHAVYYEMHGRLESAKRTFRETLKRSGSQEEIRNRQNQLINITKMIGEVEKSYGNRILPTTKKIMQKWAMLTYQEGIAFEAGKIRMDDAIAATADEYNLTVATRNTAHFKNRGLYLTDPFHDEPKHFTPERERAGMQEFPAGLQEPHPPKRTRPRQGSTPRGGGFNL